MAGQQSNITIYMLQAVTQRNENNVRTLAAAQQASQLPARPPPFATNGSFLTAREYIDVPKRAYIQGYDPSRYKSTDSALPNMDYAEDKLCLERINPNRGTTYDDDLQHVFGYIQPNQLFFEYEKEIRKLVLERDVE